MRRVGMATVYPWFLDLGTNVVLRGPREDCAFPCFEVER
jgi:hypothetical protein